MATIRSAIQIYDGMSPALRSMNTAMNVVISNFQALQNISGQAVDTNSIQMAREELAKAEITFDQIEEEIKNADLAQQQFNQDVRGGQMAAGGLQKTIMKIAGTIGTMLGLKKLAGLSDDMIQLRARLDLMNDGLQSTEELQNKIFTSAQKSRAAYFDTAQVVSKLGILAGHAFKTNEELIFFAEQMNKQFKIGGASVQEQTAAMYQLTQAMAAGRLQGDEFRSIMENAPMLAQAIAKHMGKPMGELREMSREGLITADVIKNAMFAAADETNARFESIPRTIGEIWISIKNQAIKYLDPVLVKINEIANSEQFQTFINRAVSGIAIVSTALLGVFETITAISNFVSDNWSLIAPIVWGIVGAMVAYNAVSLITNTLLAIQGTQAKIAAAAQMMQSGATFTATAAQYGLNAALMACPITWIVAGIIALIAAIYGAVAIINRFAGTSINATGVIFGAFSVLGAFLWNLFLGFLELVLGVINALVNPFIKIANFIGNVFINPISSIIYLFQSMADSVLMILEKIASAMDFVFGSNMAATVQGWRDNVREMAENAIKRYAPEENYQQLVPELDLSVESLGLKRWAYNDAWKVGYEAGEQLELKLGNIFGSIFDDINTGLDEIAFNTGGMAKSLDSSEEELKYLRDLAEQEVINRFTTAEIKIDMGGIVNQITKETDIDTVIAYLEEKLYESMSIAAEGVHS
jgi:tape measure domain-containing protein